jgi:predicted phosphodiesterase
MRIAIFSDVHGNVTALRALLEHLRSEQIDSIHCLGDFFTPYPGSLEIWELLRAHQVQCVLGNNEAALLAHYAGSQMYWSDEVRFQPFLMNAREIASILKEIQAVPMSRSINVAGKLVHLCHYSPDEVLRGLNSTFQFSMDSYVGQLAEQIVLTGHVHQFSARDIQGKQVYSVGSAGLPLKGSQQLEYALIEERQGEVYISYHLLDYDFREAVTHLLQHAFMRDYGPIAWLAFDEILTQRDRLLTFFRDYLPSHADQPRDWYVRCEAFLRAIGRWEVVAGYIED